MSELVLIKNPNQCPQCATIGAIRNDLRKCGECGARLFKPDDDFQRIKQDWILSYWVYFPVDGTGTFRGWVNSAHLDAPKPNEGPLDLTPPDKGYGEQTAQARAAKHLQELEASR